jgi:hypothetical protein
MSDDCPICCCPYTAVKRRAITCMSCDESACQECIKKHLLYTVEEPHCPSCRVGWTTTFLYEELTHNYMTKTYADHRAEILWSKEESFLPDAQLRIMDARSKGFVENWRIANYITVLEVIVIDSIKKQIIRKCPSENCKGFIGQLADDSKEWFCGLCDKKTCINCMQCFDGSEHKCKKEDVETVKLIMKDTKPCPSCGEMITKGVGCDQMWCTACHTPFSWERMEVIKTGVVHNPHYFEFIRNGGGADILRAIANECGQLPNVHLFSAHMRHNGIHYTIEQKFNDIMRAVNHITDVEYRTYTPKYVEQNLLRIRIEYLLDVITKENAQERLHSLYVGDEITRAVRPVLETFVQVAIDIINEINYDTLREIEGVDGKHMYLNTIYDKYTVLKNYINEQMDNIRKTFRTFTPIIKSWGVSTMPYRRSAEEVKSEYKLRERKQKVAPTIVF